MDWVEKEVAHQHLIDEIITSLNRMPECDSETDRLTVFAGALNVLMSGMYGGVFETRIDRCADLVNCADFVWKPIKKFTDNHAEQYYLGHKVAQRIMDSLAISATHLYMKEQFLTEIEEE